MHMEPFCKLWNKLRSYVCLQVHMLLNPTATKIRYSQPLAHQQSIQISYMFSVYKVSIYSSVNLLITQPIEYPLRFQPQGLAHITVLHPCVVTPHTHTHTHICKLLYTSKTSRGSAIPAVMTPKMRLLYLGSVFTCINKLSSLVDPDYVYTYPWL